MQLWSFIFAINSNSTSLDGWNVKKDLATNLSSHSRVYSIIMDCSASRYFYTPLYDTNNSHAISKLMELMSCLSTTRDQTEIIKNIQCRQEQVSGFCWLPSKKWTLSRILVLVYCIHQIHHIHSLLWALSGLKFTSNVVPTPLLSFFFTIKITQNMPSYLPIIRIIRGRTKAELAWCW